MSSLTIGLVFETFETYPHESGEPPDAHAEFEPESTIEALEAAISVLGHRPKRLGSPHALLDSLRPAIPGSDRAVSGRASLGVDAVFNLAEGWGGRNREAWAPVLLEMARIPTLGSDALTLSLSLDKLWANRWASSAGIPIAAQTSFSSVEQARVADPPAEFPLFVKPRWEGTAKGIRATSRVEDREAMLREVEWILDVYDQPALVEAFVPGPEYTVTLIGNDPVAVLPVVQRALESRTGIGLHALEGLSESPLDYEIPGQLDAQLERKLAALGREVFECFECRDFARIDWRLDAAGDPIFLEINPLPTFATDGTFAILAELEGIDLSEMLGRCVSAGLERLGL